MKVKNIISRITQYKPTVYTIFFVFGTLFCLMFSFVIPLFNSPDERTHLHHMMNAYGTEYLFYDINDAYGVEDTPENIIGDSSASIDRKSYFKIGMKPFKSDFSITDFKLNMEFIRYLPSAILFYLGVLFNLPMLVCMQLAEFGAIIFFLIIGYITLKIMPYKKELFCFLLLMPMMIQQCSSINYDAVLLPVCFLLVAYCFYCRSVVEKIKWKHLLCVMAMTLVIVLTKPPYALICFLFLIVPFDKYELSIKKHVISKKIIYISLGVFAVLGCVLGVVFAKTHSSNIFVKTVYCCMLNPLKALRLLGNTFREIDYFYIGSVVGDFGWLDTSVSISFQVMFFVMLLYIALGKDKDFKCKMSEKTLMVILAFALIVFIHLALISHSLLLCEADTTAGIKEFSESVFSLNRIDGVQGRYFIPMMPLLVLPLCDKNAIDKNKLYYRNQIIYYVVSCIYLNGVLFERFWG